MAGEWATPQNQLRVARAAEDLGYHSLWVFQRLLYATTPKNDYTPLPNQPWPKAFECVMDPIVSLTWVAAATKRVRLGASVLIMPYYTPVMLAKQLATLDQVSNGRVDVGVGLGWSEDEYEAVGVPFKDRGRRGDEFLKILKAIWTLDEVEYDGEFYRVPRAKVLPKPVQKPHPPITVGGYSPVVVKRAVTLGDGFNGGNVPLDRVVPVVRELHEAAKAHGRDPGGLHIVCRGSFNVFDAPQGKDRRPLMGSLDEIRDDIRRYADAGLTELFLEPNFQPGGPVLDRVLAHMEALAPAR